MNTKHAVKRSKKLGVAAAGLVLMAAQACAVGAGGENVDSLDQGYGSCDGLRAWDGGNYLFTVAAGEVIQHNNKAWQATQAISYPNAECAPGAAQAWCAGWFTDLGACGASSGSTTGGDSGSTENIPAECFANQGFYMMAAELAVSMAKELGEIHPLRDLTVSNNKVVLSSTGLSRCSAASNGCERTKDALGMQDDSVNAVISQNIFNANSYRSNLVSRLQDQASYEATNSASLPGPHTLTLASTSNDAYCGTDFTFNVNWQCSGGSGAYSMSNNQVSMEAENADSKVAASNGDTFSNSSGVMQCNSDSGDFWTTNATSAPRMDFKVNFASSGTYYVHALATGAHGGNDSLHIGLNGAIVHNMLTTNATNSLSWANSVGFNVPSAGVHTVSVYAREDGVRVDKVVVNKTSGSPSWSGESPRSSSCNTNTSSIQHRLGYFYGYNADNTVLDFRTENGTVTIDPTGGIAGDDGGSSSGSCGTEQCQKFSRNASSLVGQCCTCGGESGTWVLKSGSNTTLLCNTN
jgi:hypothetical protein